MPVINKPKRRKQKEGMNALISKIYNTSEWKKLRDWHIKTNPLCEDCLNDDMTNEDGRIGQHINCADEVHHIIPISNGKTEEEMKELAYDPNNLVSLCKFHHHLRHRR